MPDLTLVTDTPAAAAQVAPRAELVPVREHLLAVTKGDDWFEDQHDWRGEVICLTPGLCHGWMQCNEPHEINGQDTNGGTWRDEKTLAFHGVEHTWRWGVGWTTAHHGCIVQTVSADEAAYDIGEQYGAGTFIVDDDWGDPGECYLTVVRQVSATSDETSDPKAPTVTVTRTNFKTRARIKMVCTACGTTTYRVPLDEADLYEEGSREHICGPASDLTFEDRPAFRRLILHMLNGIADA